LTKPQRKSRYNWLMKLTPEKQVAHYEKMEEFWKAAGDKSTAGQYRRKAEDLRKELGMVVA